MREAVHQLRPHGNFIPEKPATTLEMTPRRHILDFFLQLTSAEAVLAESMLPL